MWVEVQTTDTIAKGEGMNGLAMIETDMLKALVYLLSNGASRELFIDRLRLLSPCVTPEVGKIRRVYEILAE